MRRLQLTRSIRVALAAVLAAGLGTVLAWSRPAAAGGGNFMYPVQDRYEPGETAVMVAYTFAAAQPGGDGGVDGGPYYGHLRADPAAADAEAPDTWPFVHPSDVPLGPTTVTETGRRDMFAARLSITFTVPPGLAPGSYEVFVCNDPCTASLGAILGGTLHVGVDPPTPIDREWLIDDPAVAQLDDGDLVAGIPVARIRSGQAGTPGYDAHLPDPPPPTTGEPAPVDRPATDEPAPADRPATTTAPATPTRADEQPAEVGLSDAAPWLAGVLAVAGIWWLAPRRRRRSPVLTAPSGPDDTSGGRAPRHDVRRDAAVTSTRS